MQESATNNTDNTEKIDLMPMNNGTNRTASAKHRKIGIIIAAILATTIVIAGIIIIVLLIRFSSSFPHGSPYQHSSYFIPESTDRNTKYALFDKEGKNITGFTIKSYHSFVDGYALIRTDEGWGVIDEDGKLTVKPEEYDGITRVGGLYSAFKAGSGKRVLLHGSGRIVTEFNSELNPKLNDSKVLEKNALAVAIHREGDKYDIYNAHGEFVREINSSEAPSISYHVSGEKEDSATVVSYKEGIVVISNRDLTEIANVSTPRKYDVYDVSSDNKIIILYYTDKNQNKSSSTIYDDVEDIVDPAYPIYSGSQKYAIINNGEFYNFEDQCRSMSFSNNSKNNVGYIYCSMKTGSGFIDENNAIHPLTDSSRRETNYVIDGSHYATYNHLNRTVTIDNDKIESVNSVSVKGAHYLVGSGGRYTIYDKEGRKVCKLPEGVSSFRGFNHNNNSIVRGYQIRTSTVSGRTITSSIYKEYIINKDCESISEQYDALTEVGNFYQAIKYDDEFSRSYTSRESALLDKDGKVRLDFGKYTSFTTARYGAEHSMIVANKSGGTFDLLNENLEVVDEIRSYPSFDFEQGIYRITTDKFTKFVTPEGREIHSIPLGDGARSRA